MVYKKGTLYITGALLAGAVSFVYFGGSLFSLTYEPHTMGATTNDVGELEDISDEPKEPSFVVTHLATPEPLKAVYMSACVAATPSFRSNLMKLVEDTELNSIVIDIKDYSGTISFVPEGRVLEGVKGDGCVSTDMKEFIGELHEKGIYVIGRITVFQDNYYTKAHPELAVKKESDKSVVWKDYKGISFIDVSAKPFWDYIVAISEESYAIGFDELNYDYIRFPSDGNMKDIHYPFSVDFIVNDRDRGKSIALRNFFEYLHKELAGVGVATSADLFGMTTTNTDDLNIGQVLEYASPYFDYIAPMVYPSHYPPNFNGWKNPNAVPYEIIKFAMDSASKRLVMASTTPAKLRPWLQDFDYPVPYTPEMVRTQIQATYDAGLTSWMLWDPSNKYTPSALLPN